MSEEHRDLLLTAFVKTSENLLKSVVCLVWARVTKLLRSVSFQLKNHQNVAFDYSRPHGFNILVVSVSSLKF